MQRPHLLKSVLLGVIRVSGAPLAALALGCSTAVAALHRSRALLRQALLSLALRAGALSQCLLGRCLAARKALDAAACCCSKMGHL